MGMADVYQLTSPAERVTSPSSQARIGHTQQQQQQQNELNIANFNLPTNESKPTVDCYYNSTLLCAACTYSKRKTKHMHQ